MKVQRYDYISQFERFQDFMAEISAMILDGRIRARFRGLFAVHFCRGSEHRDRRVAVFAKVVGTST
jgi:hypothetical protein